MDFSVACEPHRAQFRALWEVSILMLSTGFHCVTVLRPASTEGRLGVEVGEGRCG